MRTRPHRDAGMISMLADVQNPDVTGCDVCLHVQIHEALNHGCRYFVHTVWLELKTFREKVVFRRSDVQGTRSKVLDDWARGL